MGDFLLYIIGKNCMDLFLAKNRYLYKKTHSSLKIQNDKLVKKM